ncbi:hypothetical protein [Azospirillum sp. Sh1]|uniref:hypothetical protein n=1 Tax=Azospirillum sp. Sh1 TaxID=2607285 RepID=UPI0011EF4454|nr:hypothetical protein [Azospirillum sp. Sh1]KAA0573395.1 hypothetical protein FZ029_20675 [Azospirillum sp. Sh1]
MSPTTKEPFVPGADGIPLICEEFAQAAMARNQRAVFVGVSSSSRLSRRVDRACARAVAAFPLDFITTRPDGERRICTDRLTGVDLLVSRAPAQAHEYPEIPWAFWMKSSYEVAVLLADKASDLLWIDPGVVPAAREFEERFFDMDWQAYSRGVPSAIGWPTAQWEAVQANASMARAATRIIERRWFPREEDSTSKVAPEWSEGW